MSAPPQRQSDYITYTSARIRLVRIAVCDAFSPSCEPNFKMVRCMLIIHEGMDCIIIHLLLTPATRNKPVCNNMLDFHKINISPTKLKSYALVLLQGHHNLPT